MRWVFLLTITLMLALPTASAQQQKRVALVIGNATYASAGRLTNPPNDARMVTAALRQAGFQMVEAKLDLSYQAFGRALRDFRAQASGAQVALVYYAGHGIEGAGKNWLIPVDAVLQSEYDLTYEAISLDQVMSALEGASLRVVVLDACRDNPLGRSWARGTRAFSRGLAPVEADDVLVLFAAAPGQTASDGQGGNSPFATALSRRLPEPGLPIQLLGGRVRDDVLTATSNVQRPFISASITGTPFYLVPGSNTSSAETEAAALRQRVQDLERVAREQAESTSARPLTTVPSANKDAIVDALLARLPGQWRKVGGGSACRGTLTYAVTGRHVEVKGGFQTWRHMVDAAGSTENRLLLRLSSDANVLTSIEFDPSGSITHMFTNASCRYAK